MTYKKLTHSKYKEIRELSYKILVNLKDITQNSNISSRTKDILEEIKIYADQILDDLTTDSYSNEIIKIENKKIKKNKDELEFYREYGWIW